MKKVFLLLLVTVFSLTAVFSQKVKILTRTGDVETIKVETIVVAEVCSFTVGGWQVARKTDYHVYGEPLEETNKLGVTYLSGKKGTLLKIKKTNVSPNLYRGHAILIVGSVCFISYGY